MVCAALPGKTLGGGGVPGRAVAAAAAAEEVGRHVEAVQGEVHVVLQLVRQEAPKGPELPPEALEGEDQHLGAAGQLHRLAALHVLLALA